MFGKNQQGIMKTESAEILSIVYRWNDQAKKSQQQHENHWENKIFPMKSSYYHFNFWPTYNLLNVLCCWSFFFVFALVFVADDFCISCWRFTNLLNLTHVNVNTKIKKKTKQNSPPWWSKWIGKGPGKNKALPPPAKKKVLCLAKSFFLACFWFFNYLKC